MPEKEIETGDLLNKVIKTASINRFIKRHGSSMEPVSFHKYVSDLCAQRYILPARVIEKSGIERTFGHQIFNGRRNPSRDKVIQIALGFGMDYKETQELLKVARKSALYPKIKRDAVMIYALENNLSFYDIQATLSELSLPLLGGEGDNG